MRERFYRQVLLIRRVEQEIARLYPTDKIKSPVHLSIGQEAISVGVCAALADGDIAFGSYRSHALYIAKGGDLSAMLAELYGKATGCAAGKAGSMHLIDPAAGVMGASAVVGTQIPQAVGYALALKMQRRPNLVVCFFGDGATEEGAFHESLNFAALKKLPILFVCENNTYAIHSRQASRQAAADITSFVRGYGLDARKLPEMDTFAIYDAARAAVERIRAGHGPQFLECCCYRWMEHVGPNEDYQAGYRQRTELEPWQQADELARLAAGLDEATRRRIEAEVEAQVAASIEFAELSPEPEDAELLTDVCAEA